MKKFAPAHSALIQNRQFRARIACKECDHSNKVGRKNTIVCRSDKESIASVEKRLATLEKKYFHY